MIALIVLAAACLVAFVAGSLTIRVAGLAPSPDPVANVAMSLAAGVSVTPLLIEWLPVEDAARDGKSASAVRGHELLDFVFAHSEWLFRGIAGFAEALAWPA